jgi:septum formation protein
MTEPVLTLASASKIRADLLRAAGVDIHIDPARVDEDSVKSALRAQGVSPRDQADALAELKAVKIGARHGGLVLGCDQILACDGLAFDKAETRSQARANLVMLRGRRHELHSAAVLVRNGAPVWRHIATARLTMRSFSDAFLDAYLDDVGDAALSCVGAYQLEGRGAQLFSAVQGDYFAILGLPLLELLDVLREQGALAA